MILPGLRRSLAIFETTLQVETLSEQVRFVAAHGRLHRLRHRAGPGEVGRHLPHAQVALVHSRPLDGRDDLAHRGPDGLRVVGVEPLARVTKTACGQRRRASAQDIAEWIPKRRAT